MAGVDRTRMILEIDTLREQLLLLLQHDWDRQLPRITMVLDRKDADEMARKRLLTINEIQRLLAKHANWERRNNKLYRDTRRFRGEFRRDRNETSDSDSESDTSDSEAVMTNLAALREERIQKRLKKNTGVIRIVLRNGYDIVVRPEHSPQVVESSVCG